MTQARATSVIANESANYLIRARSYNDGFIAGIDPQTGKNYAHRKEWLEEHIARLLSIYSIDLLACSILNHELYMVLHTYPKKAARLSQKATLERWLTIHPIKEDGPVQPHQASFLMPRTAAYRTAIDTARQRLGDPSWLMRDIKWPSTLRFNAEDGCSGRFWHRRYGSHRLEGKIPLERAIEYVQLKPVQEILTQKKTKKAAQ